MVLRCKPVVMVFYFDSCCALCFIPLFLFCVSCVILVPAPKNMRKPVTLLKAHCCCFNVAVFFSFLFVVVQV